MNTKETTNASDEIDLEKLFKLIVNAINAFFNSISIALKTIFHLFITLILFLRSHFLKFCLMGFLGVVVGSYIDYKKELLYKSSMLVQPNFNSVQQLYSNITFYNHLAKNQKSKKLANTLNIPHTVAKNIKNIKISAFLDQEEIINQFNKFIQGLDSITRKTVVYKDYFENFNNLNAKFHVIEMVTTMPGIAKQCKKGIINAIETNEYFKAQKKVNYDNIILIDSIIRIQQKEIQNLKSFYYEIRVLEAQKSAGSTNVNFSGNNNDLVSEIKSFNIQIKELKEEKVLLNINKSKTKNTLNIISEFTDGIVINNFWSKKIVQIPILSISILFLILIMFEFNKYLANYRRDHVIKS